MSLLVNDKKVSDHHAIIPTLELEKADLSELPVGERNILLLVCRELLCAAAEPFVYETVTATFTLRRADLHRQRAAHPLRGLA